MSLAEFSIKRPVFIIMLVLIVIVLGAISFIRLPIDLMPEISYPTLNIMTSYPNTGPEEIEQIITRPIEEAMSAVSGVEEVYSVSSEGSSSVRVMFNWGTNLDSAMNDVRERLDRIIPRLPEGIERPMLRRFDPAQMPILILGATSKLDPVQMRRIIDEQITYRLERAPGVASVDIWGGREREIQVNLIPEKIKSLGLPLDQIISAIREGNIDYPAGVIERGNHEILIRVPGIFNQIDEIREQVVTLRGSTAIRLKDIAEVEDTFRKITRVVRINGDDGTRLAIFKQSGTNTVEVAKNVFREIQRLERDLPQIKLIPVRDSSQFIRNAIGNVGNAAVYGGILAILVLLFFLNSIRSTLVIAISIPVSIIATFALIYFSGFTLNVMTLGGLALGIGMLLDNSIVVLENIFRLNQDGKSAYEASLQGTKEVGAAIIASTMTTIVVFLPMVFVRGMSGILFKQLAFVISFALICSLFVALTIVPMLSSRLLAISKQQSKQNVFSRLLTGFQNFFVRLENSYKKVLHYALSHRPRIIIAAALLFVISLLLVKFIGSEFMPKTDEGEVRVTVEMEVGTRLSVINEKFRKITALVRQAVPEAVSLEESIGGGWRSAGSHTGNITIKLISRAQRHRSSEEIAAALRKKLSNISGALIRVRAGSSQFLFMGAGGEESVQLEVRGFDLETAEALAHQVKKAVESVSGISDVRISRDLGKPEELLVVNRQKAADMKLTVTQIGKTLETALSGTQASTFREAGKEYRILVKLKNAEQLSLEEILNFTLTNRDGQQISLRNVVEVKARSGPQRIERRDRERILIISAEIQNRNLSEILSDIRLGLKRIPIPAGFEINFSGDYEEQQKAFRELLLSIILAILLVYMVMAMLYESLRAPLIVMFSVPLATIGVIWMLFLTGTTFNVQSYIGAIMLGGIVVNNAILLVDYINLLRRRDRIPLREAIEEAGRRRLRPILMTSLTTILAMLPLALSLGEGSEAQSPMARAVVGGLISSTFITLIVVPVAYSLFEGLKNRK